MEGVIESIANAKKEVLVDIVKLAQKRGMEGNKGGWKEFLRGYDRKLGVSLCDPAKRSTSDLVAFLKTFNKEDDFKLFDKVIQSHSHRDNEASIQDKSADIISPEQKLVSLTVGHPQYPSSYSFPSHEEGWLVTKRSKKSKEKKSTTMIAVDCEMVLCEDGTDALARICVVDRDLKVKLDKLVNPNKAVADYRTDITGISAKDLDGITFFLEDVQHYLQKLLSHGTILVGHSLNNDMQALKLDHARVIDTSLIFRYWSGSNFRRPSLNDLCKTVLGYELRKDGAPHNCVNDACAAMKLVLAKIGGVDDAIPFPTNEIHKAELAKLLLHKIPTSIPEEELHNIIPGDFKIELKLVKRKAESDKYSAFAVFKNQEEADQAFLSLDGTLDKDSSGRPQKFVHFHLGTGVTGNLYVRKMACDDHPDQETSKKRSFQNENPSESKKLKVDQTIGDRELSCDKCKTYLKEIENLKVDLKQRDQEISSLNKIIITLTRKQLGL